MDLLDDNLDTNEASFEDLVGEGRRYKTKEDAARALIEKDRFIEQLKTEQTELRSDLETRINYQDFLDRMKSMNEIRPEERQDPPAAERPSPQSAAQDIEKMLDEKLRLREEANRREQNIASAKKQLQSVFGSDYSHRLKAQAEQLGVSVKWLEDVAAANPQALMRLMGAEQKKDGTVYTPPKSSGSVDFSPSSGVKNNAYYEKLYKENPTEYFSPRVQNERHREALRQGEAFFD